jgi:periplasmic protein TonB
MHVSSTAQAMGRRNPAGFLFVVAFHVAFVWILNDALGLRLLGPAPPDPMEARLIEEKPIVDDAPVTPLVNMLTNQRAVLEDRPLDFPVPPDIPVDGADPTDGITFTPDPGPVTADPGPARTGVMLDARHPLTQPAYPTSSIRLGEEGNLDVEILVGRDGRVADARVARSSGYPRLDQAAIAEALRMWRLTPATVGGEPVEMWHRIRVTFRLDQR